MRYRILLLVCLCYCLCSAAQDDRGFFSLSEKKQKQFLQGITDRFHKLDDQLSKKTTAYLNKLKKQEYKLYKKLYKKDSVKAKEFLAESEQKYPELQTKLNGASAEHAKQLKEYIPHFDTLKTTLSFLNKSIGADNPLTSKLKGSQKVLSQFETRMQLANEVKTQLKDRKKLLEDRFSSLGLTKQLKNINKEMFYYQEQLKEYKDLLADPEKLERKAIAALLNSTAFKEFMKKNSMLAQLFRLPDNYYSPENLATLQTQASVRAALTQRFAGAGVNPREYMQGQMNQAQAELNKLKSKIKRIGGGSSSDIDMPENFKQNTQKTKSFLKRLEYGADFQTQKINGYFPTTTDVALTLGYKLNDKSIIGIGASYKAGLGSIQHIKLTHEGVGFRSYVDWKLKGSFWISGGYEQNYLQRFNDFRSISDVSLWRQSALLGITKKVNVGKSKSSKVQLLYDFFHKKDNIPTQPLMFRIGYGF